MTIEDYPRPVSTTGLNSWCNVSLECLVIGGTALSFVTLALKAIKS
jgi:hypothetical protein